jgi:hydrogenase maturation factor
MSLDHATALPGRCATCADEGGIGRVVDLLANGLAIVALGNGPAEVAIDLVPDARVGDALVVHLGVALARLGDGREMAQMP